MKKVFTFFCASWISFWILVLVWGPVRWLVYVLFGAYVTSLLLHRKHLWDGCSFNWHFWWTDLYRWYGRWRYLLYGFVCFHELLSPLFQMVVSCVPLWASRDACVFHLPCALRRDHLTCRSRKRLLYVFRAQLLAHQPLFLFACKQAYQGASSSWGVLFFCS